MPINDKLKAQTSAIID